MAEVTRAHIAAGIDALGVAGRPVCIHVSMRSFGRLEQGPETVVDGLLDAGCTVLVPTFSHQFEVAPPEHDRPARNGLDYSTPRTYLGESRVYRADAAIEPWLGAVPAHVLTRAGVTRGGDPVGSFAAVGPMADELIVADPGDIFGPLRTLTRLAGWVVLMGVGLNRMTLLHLAEVVAGRRPFVRWVNGPAGHPTRLGVGLCSEGFPKLASPLASLVQIATVGASEWRAFPSAETVAAAAAAMRADPRITHCGRDCIECDDAIAGGPIG